MISPKDMHPNARCRHCNRCLLITHYVAIEEPLEAYAICNGCHDTIQDPQYPVKPWKTISRDEALIYSIMSQ